MDFYSIEGNCLNKFDIKEGPKPLFLLIKKELSHTIQALDLSLSGVQDAMHRESFSFDIYKRLKDFYQDDWDLVGCFLYDSDHTLHSLILEREDPQGHPYRIMVNIDPEVSTWRLEMVNSNGIGKLFETETHHPHELDIVGKFYQSFLPELPKEEAKPKPKKEPNCFETEKDYVCDLSQFGRYVFRSHLGPSTLFGYGYELLKGFQQKGLTLTDPDFQSDLKTRPIFVKQALLDFLSSKWRIESIVTNKYLTIEGLLLFHIDETRFHLFVNPYGKVLYIIDCEIESGMPVFEEDSVYRQAFLMYETEKAKKKRLAYEKSLPKQPLPTPKLPEPEVLPPVQEVLPVVQETKEIIPVVKETRTFEVKVETKPSSVVAKPKKTTEDPYADWLDKFKSKRILILGDSTLSPDDMKKICRECGFQKENVVIYNEYTKMTNLDFTVLKGKQDKYCGIVLGPTPHSLKGLGGFASLASMLSSEDYPYTAEATRNGDSKDFKITRTSLLSALGDIIRHELAVKPALV